MAGRCASNASGCPCGNGSSSVAPSSDTDDGRVHITLNCGSVEPVARFLIDVLGLSLTESIRPPDHEGWFNAFLRCRDRHHHGSGMAGLDRERA